MSNSEAAIFLTAVLGFLSLLSVQLLQAAKDRAYAMGRLTPDRPRQLQGPPKTIKPPFSPPGQGRPGAGLFKCGYCGRYGKPGSCEGCGAPNEPPNALDRPFTDIPLGSVIRAGILTPAEARRYVDVSTFGCPGRFLELPAFPMVKR